MSGSGGGESITYTSWASQSMSPVDVNIRKTNKQTNVSSRSCWALKPAHTTGLSFPCIYDCHATTGSRLDLTAVDCICYSSLDRGFFVDAFQDAGWTPWPWCGFFLCPWRLRWASHSRQYNWRWGQSLCSNRVSSGTWLGCLTRTWPLTYEQHFIIIMWLWFRSHWEWLNLNCHACGVVWQPAWRWFGFCGFHQFAVQCIEPMSVIARSDTRMII